MLVKLPPEGATTYCAPDTGGTQAALMSSTVAQQKKARAEGRIMIGVTVFWIIFVFICYGKGQKEAPACPLTMITEVMGFLG